MTDIKTKVTGLGLWCLMPLSKNFSNYSVANSYIGGRNWSTQRKALTCRQSLTNSIT